MTSQINYADIDGTYPIAGQDNSSQGFRDNFTVIKNSFESASTEITELQNKVLLKAPLTNGTFNNDMQGNVITNALTQGFRELLYKLGTVTTGTTVIDFNVGSYQSLTLGASTTLSFANFSGLADTFAKIRLQITVPNTAYTVTFPASVSLNVNSIAGMNSNVLTFGATGTYVFELSTLDGGTTFNIQDLNRSLDTVQDGNLTITKVVGNVTTAGITMTVANIGGVAVGNITATNFFGNITTLGGASASFTGNLTANNIIANTSITGTLATALQPNITLLGTLSSLSVSANANIGNLTVTGMADLCGGTQYGIQYVSLGNSGSQQLFSNVGLVIVEFTSNISSATITMPATPADGQAIKIGFGNNTCSTLSQGVTGGQTILAPATAGNAAAGGTWAYRTASSTWYKVG